LEYSPNIISHKIKEDVMGGAYRKQGETLPKWENNVEKFCGLDMLYLAHVIYL
jgi:hypothetical protein